MNTIFTKQEESLLAGLGFTFQPINRKNTTTRVKDCPDSPCSYKIYQLYEDLISTQGFNSTNLLILLNITKNCLASIDNDESTESESNLDFEESFLLAFALLSFYINQNYVGPQQDQSVIPDELKTWLEVCQKQLDNNASVPVTNDKIQNNLILDGEELIDNIKFPILIVIIEKLLDYVEKIHITRKKSEESTESLSSNSGAALILWWKIRTWFLHQQILEERSQELFKRITKSENEFLEFIETIEKDQEITLQAPLRAMFYVEMSEIYLYFYDIEKSKHFVDLAKLASEVKASPAGVLGRRTRYQETDLAQLVLHVELTNSSKPVFQSMYKAMYPQNVLLGDDVRLEKIQVSSQEADVENVNPEISAGHLTPLQHLVVLSEFRTKSKYLPQDGVYNEELLAYLQFLLEHPKLWCVQFVALFQRSLLETSQRRTIERSMSQLQALKMAIESSAPIIQERIKCFFGSGSPFLWEVEQGLGQVLASLGLFKEALDISLRLNDWEDVINCYTFLNLRHKAEEVIRAELEKNSASVKLWIYLGDATDNIEYYEKAWDLSKCRSSRAQRQWGNYYFNRKQYEESLEHFELSLKLNPIEHLTWTRLGYAALQCEKWELSTKAYQHATELNGDNFELWNNLANGFLKSGNKTKALRAFQEAIKCNYESWKVWENLLVVATDCKAFEDVLRSYNRLIDLRSKWEDEQVLRLLVHAIVVDVEDSSGLSTRKKFLRETLKLFGRITSSARGNPIIWKLYSDLQAVAATEAIESKGSDDVPDTHLYNSVTYMERAIKCSILDQTWNKVEPKIRQTSDFVLQYIERIVEFQKFQTSSSNSGSSEQLKNEAEFLVRKVYAGIKQTNKTAVSPEPFQEILKKLEDEMRPLGFFLE